MRNHLSILEDCRREDAIGLAQGYDRYVLTKKTGDMYL